MKKGKIVVVSVLGLAILTVSYFVMKKRNKLKESDIEQDIEQDIEEEVEVEEEVEEIEEKIFSEEIITKGKDLRSKINRLRLGSDSIIERDIVNSLGALKMYSSGSKQGTSQKKEIWDWYDSQNFSVLGDLRVALEKVLSPLWSDRAERTMFNWKLR